MSNVPTSGGQLDAECQKRAPAYIDCCHNERFIHRNDRVPVAVYSRLIAECRRKRRAQADAHVFHAVVAVHRGIAAAFDREVESSVAGKKREHMVKKAHTSFCVADARTVKVYCHFHVGFGRFLAAVLVLTIALQYVRISERKVSI